MLFGCKMRRRAAQGVFRDTFHVSGEVFRTICSFHEEKHVASTGGGGVAGKFKKLFPFTAWATVFVFQSLKS